MDTTIEVLLKAAEFIELQHQQQNMLAAGGMSPVMSSSPYFSPMSMPPKIVQKCHNANNHNTPANNSINRFSNALRMFNNANFTHDISTNDNSNLFISKLKSIDNKANVTRQSNKTKSSEEFQEYAMSRPEKSNHNKQHNNNSSCSESCDSSDSSKPTSESRLSPNEALSLDSDIAKSPINIYSTSPSSFSCSSSSSSLLSLSNMGLVNHCKEEVDNCDLDESMSNCGETDKYKPEDIKRNKMIHNILEKNRRAHLKDCFENLQNELPQYREKKVTNLLILKQAIKFLEQSKRVESECETELQRLLNNKAALMQRLNRLKSEQQQEQEQQQSEQQLDVQNWMQSLLFVFFKRQSHKNKQNRK